MADTQGFPIVNQPFVDATLNITSAWRQLLVTLWNRTGASGGGGIGTLLVNPGTGTNSRELNVALSDYANVNDFLDTGDTNYDGAFVRALAAKNHAHVPAKPWIADPDNFYHTTTTIILQSGQSIVGDGAGVSRIVCDTLNVPTVTIWHNVFWYALEGLTIAHLPGATVGGDGIYQGQALNDWVDNCLGSNLLLAANYEGANLGKSFSGHWRDVQAIGNAHTGFRQTTTGNSDVFGSPNGGPLQLILINCAASSNGLDGYSYEVTGTAFGGPGVGSSMGTLINCVTFANGHHGVSAVGTALQPLRSIRLDGGFYGQDLGIGIYLDTYGDNHAICPQFIELSGSSNIYLTANNTRIAIRHEHNTGAWFDGITSVGATDVEIIGGSFVNNGLRGSGGIGLTWAGIRIDGGSATINAVTCMDTGSGIQSYGVSVAGDDVIINGSRLTRNGIAPIVWATGPTNSVVMGCLPVSINLANFGDVTTGTLHVSGAAVFTGTGPGVGVTIQAGGLALTTGVAGNGIVADNIAALVSAGVGMGATGIPGRLSTATITSTVDIIANGQFHANGGAAFTSALGITVTAGGLAFTTGVINNGIVVDNVTMRVSGGVGTAATAIAGRLDTTSLVMTGAISGATTINSSGRITSGNGVTVNGTLTGATSGSFSGTLSAAAINGTTITSSVDLIANGQLHCNGAAAFTSGGVNITSGGMVFTAGVGGNGIQVDNITVRTSLGVGTPAVGVIGRIDVTNGIYLGGVPYTHP